jgi:hypothetical protein
MALKKVLKHLFGTSSISCYQRRIESFDVPVQQSSFSLQFSIKTVGSDGKLWRDPNGKAVA